MAYQPVPGTVQVTTVALLDSQRITNVYHVFSESPWVLASMQDLANEFISWLREEILPLLAQELVYTLIEVLELSVENGLYYGASIGTPNAGQDAGGVMPNEVAFCVSMRTNQSGRSYRGRKYYSGLGRADVTGNAISSTVATAFLAAHDDLRSRIEDTWGSLVIVSRIQNGVTLPEAITTPVVSFTYEDLTVDSMRTRKPGNGS